MALFRRRGNATSFYGLAMVSALTRCHGRELPAPCLTLRTVRRKCVKSLILQGADSSLRCVESRHQFIFSTTGVILRSAGPKKLLLKAKEKRMPRYARRCVRGNAAGVDGPTGKSGGSYRTPHEAKRESLFTSMRRPVKRSTQNFFRTEQTYRSR